MRQMTCQICGNETGNTSFQAKEMMFGLRDEFTYVECAGCGVVQIQSVPDDMARYYPANYYSYSCARRELSAFKKWRLGLVSRHRFGETSILTALATLFSRKLPVWMDKKYFRFDSRILDVGCGSGALLLDMHRSGFTNLAGVDPFIAENIDHDCGVSIAKKVFLETDGAFDFIMFHHSFEHMDQPLKIFQHLQRTLNKGCHALIRIPVADSFAYRKYKSDWVNLDPPRHFFLHTKKSIRLLAEQSGLELAETIYDSTHQQFVGSELYRRNLTLDSYNQGQHRNLFSQSQMRKFKAEAARLNKRGEGDLAGFFIRKA